MCKAELERASNEGGPEKVTASSIRMKVSERSGCHSYGNGTLSCDMYKDRG